MCVFKDEILDVNTKLVLDSIFFTDFIFDYFGMIQDLPLNNESEYMLTSEEVDFKYQFNFIFNKFNNLNHTPFIY